MAGTIPLSLTQQFDEFGKPLSGALLYIIQAGTVSTPQQPYLDAALTLVTTNPILLDAAGRVPQFFLADGYIKVRLDDKLGVTQLAADSILVIGPSAGSGGGGSVDPTSVWQTGDIKPRYDTGVHAGFVRANGRTIGSATSGATERANADCQALFNFLWNIDTSLPVTPSRGASSAADYAANKQIGTPDYRGCAITGLGDMGNTDAGRLTAGYFGANPALLGALGGSETTTLTAAHIPASGLGCTGTTGNDTPDHSHAVPQAQAGQQKPASGGNPPFDNNTTVQSGGASTRHVHPFTGTVTGGGGQAHRTVGPRKLSTIYIKL
jgi:hypothetical protein